MNDQLNKKPEMIDKDKEKEFTDLLLQHQHIIYKVCLMYAQDKEDIADLYQETVYNLWKSFGTFENRSSCKKRSRLLQQKRRCCYSSDVAKLMFSS